MGVPFNAAAFVSCQTMTRARAEARGNVRVVSCHFQEIYGTACFRRSFEAGGRSLRIVRGIIRMEAREVRLNRTADRYSLAERVAGLKLGNSLGSVRELHGERGAGLSTKSGCQPNIRTAEYFRL